MSGSIEIRAASPGDTVTIAALATQVFLDTYATSGVRPDLAREAFREYSERAFAARLDDPQRTFLVAVHGEALVGFAELLTPAASPVAGITGAELVRLYVQHRSQRSGLGRRLLRESERTAAALSASSLWLTAWDGNANALAFYARMGYADVGATTYSFESNTYGNRVFAKRLAAA
jgi:ribosomal protein S18 acetylase RimI-like enzyme